MQPSGLITAPRTLNRHRSGELGMGRNDRPRPGPYHILGHANMRSTMIYAHVQHDLSRRAANRLAKTIAAALVGQTKSAPKREKVA